jgi:hypothetical protein
MSPAPKRIQRKRTKGWRMPPGAVFVGRPTAWGNPFTIAACIEAGYAGSEAEARTVCVDAFRDWLKGDGWAAGISPDWTKRRAALLEGLPELRGKDLACWCPVDGWPCHADVLIELANA